MPKENEGQLVGYFLHFTEVEEQVLLEFLSELEYTPDKDGLKKFIMDEVQSDTEGQDESVARHVKRFISENPEVITKGTAALGKLFRSIVTKT